MHVNMHCQAEDELPNGEIFYARREAQFMNESWRCHSNTKRPLQCTGLSPNRARAHRADGPKANHALPFNLHHSSGAAQRPYFVGYH